MARIEICSECRAADPWTLNCIHTFAPRVRVSSIADTQDWREGLKDIAQPYDSPEYA